MVLTYKFLEPHLEADAARILETINGLWDEVATDAQQGMRLTFVPTAGLHYVAAELDGEYAGMWVLNELESGELDVHTLLLPDFTGHAVALGHGALDWAFSQGVADRLRTKVPEFNHGAQVLAEAMGFVAEPYTEPDTYRKYGIDWSVQTYTLTMEQYYANRSNRRRGISRRKRGFLPAAEPGAEAGSGPSPATG